eukprot:CAMPEP_0181328640 /NCGR_PEP_ID=MMETSP1101-20121128/22845_1 /TAXON_ID=46948 /ORGANISM="Rhodomonas abbreviata, Strain Caron Lab Isolate" /LENGTH=108 /DNA_ID=CAMNT_0023437585 /DNA_START=23 /DNA_END=349 /DNA_ORIENTATION=-
MQRLAPLARASLRRGAQRRSMSGGASIEEHAATAQKWKDISKFAAPVLLVLTAYNAKVHADHVAHEAHEHHDEEAPKYAYIAKRTKAFPFQCDCSYFDVKCWEACQKK